MNKKSLIFVIVFVLLAAGLYFWQSSEPQPVSMPNDVMTEEAQLKLDREHLTSLAATPHQKYGAMIRLAQRHEDAARAEALRQVTSPNALLRGGAAQALGYFDDAPSLEALKNLLNDKEKSVRLFAIQGLGHSTESLREQELLAVLENPNLDLEMQVEVDASLLNASKGQNQEAITRLLETARAGDGPANTEAAQRLVTLVPDDPRVLDMIRRKISAAKNERITALGTRYLSSRTDPWIRDVLKILSTHPSPSVRAAVIQSLHRVCPADRWAILDEFLASEQDEPTMKLVLEEPRYLRGKPAVQFLKKALATDLTENLKKVAEESLKKVEAAGGAELCE